ncbi:MAG: DUF1080 domain-containing protein [Chloroflexota bacterium]|nr:DUF1080 domain-containing protein [Chloroflexota bacterium]
MSSMYPPYGGGAVGRSCQRCGAPLPPNEVTCGNCGQYNAPASNPAGMQGPSSTSWGGGAPPTAYGQGQQPQYPGSAPQWGQQPPMPTAPPTYGGMSSAQQPQSYNGMPGMSSTQQQYNGMPGTSSAQQQYNGMPGVSSANNYYGASQTGYPARTTTGGFQQPQQFQQPSGFQSGAYPPSDDGFNTPPTRKRGPGIGAIVGIVLLVVVLLGAGTGAYLYLKHSSTGNTPVATPVTTAPTAIPVGPLLFKDSFTNNQNHWDTTSAQGKYSVKLSNGSLVLEDDENTLFPELLPNKTFDNFTLTVDASLSKGDPNSGYGIYIRMALNQNTGLPTTYYRFELYGDGTYGIFKGALDATGATQSSKIIYGRHPAVQKQGSVNHITVVAKGTTMSLLVNGQSLYTFSDTSYRSGVTALFVSNVPQTSPGAQATFANLAIYQPAG